MSQQPKNIKPKPKIKKHIFGKTLTVVGTLFVLTEIAFWFFAIPLFRTVIQSFVYNESNGVYSVDFASLQIELTTRTVVLTEFQLKADTARYRELKRKGLATKSLYQIRFDELKFSKLKVIQLIRDHELNFSKISILNPVINLIGLPLSKKKHTQYDAIHDDLYAAIEPYLNAMSCKKVSILNGYFDMYMSETEVEQKTSAESITIELYDFRVDSLKYTQKDELFYSKDFFLRTKNYRLLLNDKLHSVLAGELLVSTKRSVIVIDNIIIRPGYVSPEKSKLPLYFVEIPRLKIYGTDIYDFWYNKNVTIDSVLMQEPKIRIQAPVIDKKQAKKQAKIKINYRDIFQLVKGKIKSVHIKEFTFSNAKFQLRKGVSTHENNINIEDCALVLHDFLLDSLSVERTNKIMYADNFTLSVNKYEMLFAQNTHKLEASKFYISTQDKNISVQNIKIKPIEKAVNKTQLYMNISVPNLQLTNIDFFNAFKNGILTSDLLLIQNPYINITSYKAPKQKKLDINTKQIKKTSVIYGMLSEYINTLNINKVALKSGKFSFANKNKKAKDAFYKGNISFILTKVKLDKKTALQTDKLIHAKNFELQLTDFSMKTKDDFHLLRANLIQMSSIDSILEAKNISYTCPENINKVKALKNYHKNSIYDINLPYFVIKNVDISAFIFKKKLQVSSIYLGQPYIKINQFVGLPQPEIFIDSLETLANQTAHFLQNDTCSTLFEDTLQYSYKRKAIEFLKQKLNLVDIKNVFLDSAFIDLTKQDTLCTKMVGFQNQISAKIHNFYINQDSIEMSINKFLFSDSIKIVIFDYNALLPDGLHKVKANKISFSSKDSTIVAYQVRIFPSYKLQKQVEKPNTYIIYLPEIEIIGLNQEQFLHNQYIEINKLNIKRPAIIQTKHIGVPLVLGVENKKNIGKITLPNGIKGIAIHNIGLSEGKIELDKERNDSIFKYGSTNFSLNLKNLIFDSINIEQGKSLVDFENDSLLFTQIKIDLPDSIYTFTGDTLALSIKKQKLKGVNFTLTYDSVSVSDKAHKYKRKQNQLVKFEIPELNIEGINYLDIALNKTIDLQKITINKPEVEIIQFKKPKSKKTIENVEKELFTQLNNKYKIVKIGEIEVNDAIVTLKKKIKNNYSSVKMKGITASIINFDLYKKDTLDTKKLFFSDDISLHFHHYFFVTKDSMYNISLNEIGLSSLKSRIYVNDFSMIPRYGQYEFAKVKGFQKSVLYIEGKKIEASGVDFRNFLKTQRIDIKKIQAEGFKIHIFKDKQLEEDTTKRPIMPLDIIRKAKTLINIDSIKILDSYLAYEQNSSKKQSTGLLTLETLNGTITNLTNDTSLFEKKKNTRMKISAKLMGKGQMNASFRFPLSKTKREYLFAGNVDTFDLTQMNPFIENTVFVSVQQGKANKLQFTVKANDKFAEGRMRLYYSNLKIKIKDTANSQRNGVSMLANSILRSNNPKRKGRKLIEGKIYTEVIPYKQVFFMWTQAIISGAVSSLGYRTKQMKRKDKLMKILKRKKKKQSRIDRKTEKAMKKEMEQELRRMAREQRKQKQKQKQNKPS